MSFAIILLFAIHIIVSIGAGFCNKLYSSYYTGPEKLISPLFSIVYGLCCAVFTLVFNRFSFHPDRTTVIMGVVNGFSAFFYNFSFIRASQQGPLALTTMLGTFGGILIPLFFSLFAWGEDVSPINLAGIAVMLFSLVLFNLKGLGNGPKAKWTYYLWLFVQFLSNGIYCVLMSSQQIACHYTLRAEMIIITFSSNVIISFIYMKILQLSGGSTETEPLRLSALSGKCILFLLLSGLCAATGVNLLMYIIQYIPAYILYPVLNGGFMLANAALAAYFLGERLSRLQVAAMLLAAFSIILLNL